MNLTIVVRSMETGGTQRQIVELASRLAEHDVQCTVIVFYEDGEMLADLRATGVLVKILRKRSRYHLLGFAWRLVAALRASRPDVVYAFLTSPSVIATVLHPLVPRSKLAWGVRGSAAQFSKYDAATGMFFTASRILSCFADLVICNSVSGSQDHLRAGYPGPRMVVIPNGIDTAKFHMNRNSREHWRDRWGARDVDRIIVVPARLDPMKGHEVFVKAAALLEAHPDLLFVLVGPGDSHFRERLSRQSEMLGLSRRLVQEGGVEDMPAIYNAADLVVLPSLWGEGFPNVVGEAMACGTPAVVTDVGDSALVVGATGEIATPGDSTALADAIERALERLEADPELMARNARLRIETRFSADNMATATVAALQKLCRGRG